MDLRSARRHRALIDLQITEADSLADVGYWRLTDVVLTFSMSAFRGKADIPSLLANVR